MFDVGGSELLVIGIVALIVVGPKDLPRMFHALGQFTAKARQMAREFQRAMETAAEESGAKDLTRDLTAMTSAKNLGLDAVKEATKRLETWDEVKRASTTGLQPDPEAPHGPETAALVQERAAKSKAAKSLVDPEAPIEVPPEPKAKAKPRASAAKTAKASAAKSAPTKTASKTPTKTAPKSAATKAAPAKTATAAKTTKTAAKGTGTKRAAPAKQGDA